MALKFDKIVHDVILSSKNNFFWVVGYTVTNFETRYM